MKKTKGIYWAAGVIVALMWLAEWPFTDIPWRYVALGLFTGAMLTAWAVEITGNKLPASRSREP